jgi:Tfp pilus assembly protein PilZ
MEKRRHRRYSRRLKVRFGEKDFDHQGFTHDVSQCGMFVVAGYTPKVGARLHFEITTTESEKMHLEGVVARLTVVAPELRSIVKGGFGVRFLTASEILGELVPQVKNKVHFSLSYPSQAAFLTAYDAELKRGGIFLWTEKAHPVNATLNLEIEAGWTGQTTALEVKVVHVMPGSDGRFGTALMFVHSNDALTQLTSLASQQH